ncbi:hypothetical protein A3F55_01905 [Candidatus Adlerbacteria bacterium RIFCSPHIGHO2_12_FULL_53_18]|uniref:HicB-like antitoxin of toxin-antitoxin system domain-containing protein n=1 Tax=Candidatus Adlerbacteria bacterium RIFCSPHIGHO2_12_FULL_53_18 TaxID=1797242 RepID=A0A1F4XTY5_9BACT|nr:MAG: hypothetical protein A3F55_01905 [Candidatus Adlerbacteria bacterium RIFCSPHIGHO2_12_FULL_53_18]
MAKLSYNLPVVVMKQGKHFVAYSPVLDLSTVGKSEKDAQRMFTEAANIFFEEIIRKGTTDEVLSDLGWERVQKKWNPPQVVSSESIGIRVPAFA